MTTHPGVRPPLPTAGAGATIPLAAGNEPAAMAPEPVLCGHCGRTASNGISCQGICVADSGY
ncbi:hypothetical protein [Cyanobium gracile]|uniref:Uncharacterized protein n=1 Tax=Cyanobium gracile UHCC 0281 TaxID=3110309 RepID=A0ABU5SS97_9CYAN|nr:hypothetical protein [Cyanobium gracile]MEA5441397.1 hypothetical protein [Cyanobium gracile UHCC 0281]